MAQVFHSRRLRVIRPEQAYKRLARMCLDLPQQPDKLAKPLFYGFEILTAGFPGVEASKLPNNLNVSCAHINIPRLTY